jgi:hypothetical protein
LPLIAFDGLPHQVADLEAALGFEPLDVFDLWQRELGGTLRWLHAHHGASNEIMENVVRLLSGDVKHKEERAAVRAWAEIPIPGCTGRFVPRAGQVGASGAVLGASGAVLGGPEALADAKSAKAATEKKSFRFSLYKDLVKEAVKVTKPKGGMESYEAWLRQHVTTVSETEVNVQLGNLTLNQHQMELLDLSIAEHEDFIAVFGAPRQDNARYQCGEVERTEHRLWYRLIAVEHDVQVWDPDSRSPPGPLKVPGMAIPSPLKVLGMAIPTSADLGLGDHGLGGEAGWVRDALEEAKKRLPALADSKAVLKNCGSGDAYVLFHVVLPDLGVREIMVIRQPLTVHVWRLESYGRRWLPVLEPMTSTCR